MANHEIKRVGLFFTDHLPSFCSRRIDPATKNACIDVLFKKSAGFLFKYSIVQHSFILNITGRVCRVCGLSWLDGRLGCCVLGCWDVGVLGWGAGLKCWVGMFGSECWIVG